MAKAKADTQRIYIRLDTGAVDLLGRLAPSAHKRGAYVSELIRRAAVEAGLIEPGTPGGTLDLTVLRHQLAAFEARYLDLQRRVEAALEAQEGGC